LLVERNPKVGAFLEEQLAARSRELAESERALEEFRSRHQIATSLTEERRLVAAELAALRTSLAETQTREGELKTQIQAMSAKAHQDAGIPRSYYQLRERLAALETEESELALRVTADHPRLREIREQLGGLRDRLRSSGIESAYGSAKEQEDFNVNLQTELTRVRSELEAATVRRFALSARVEEVRARLKSLEVIDGEFNRLQARVKSNEEAHRALQSRVEEARMASVRDEEKLVGIRMIEQAQPPAAPVDSRKEAKKALGILVSAFAAFGAAFALQWSRGRIETADEVE